MLTDIASAPLTAEGDQIILVDGIPMAISPRQRDAMLQLRANLLRELIQGVIHQPDGVALRFAGDGLAVQQAGDLLPQFVRLARLREPSLRFTIELEPDGGPLWLRVVGARARDFVRVVFTLA